MSGSNRLDALVEEALAGATMPDAYFHGERHWRRVARIGLRLRDSVTEADTLVLFLFALFHDSMRENEDEDPDHGIRGRILGEELIPKFLEPSASQQAAFKEACDHHTDGKLSEDPTIAVCWDADRLDLWRVGKQPGPRFMSTPVARNEGTILWAESILEVEPPTWKELTHQTASAFDARGALTSNLKGMEIDE